MAGCRAGQLEGREAAPPLPVWRLEEAFPGQAVVGWWHALNILLFARRGSDPEACPPSESHAHDRRLSLVRPRNLLVQTPWTFRTHRVAARHAGEAGHARVVAAWRGETTMPPLPDAVMPGQGGGDPEAGRRVAGCRLGGLRRLADQKAP